MLCCQTCSFKDHGCSPDRAQDGVNVLQDQPKLGIQWVQPSLVEVVPQWLLVLPMRRECNIACFKKYKAYRMVVARL